MIDDILAYNKAFVEQKGYEKYVTDKFPNKKTAIITCMDTRLTELLPTALGMKNGDAKIIKNAGGVISHPFGSVMRSLLIAIYELDIHDILVIGHTDCGAMNTDSHSMIQKMTARGISPQSIDMLEYYGINFDSWLSGFQNPEASIEKTVELIRRHPLVPEGIAVYGLMIDSLTGELHRVSTAEPSR